MNLALRSATPRPGSARNRNVFVAFEKKVETLAAGGGVTPGWTEWTRRWANVAIQSGGEQMTGDQIVSVASYVVTCDWDSGLEESRPSDRIKVLKDDRYLYVVSRMNPDERNQELKFLCREVQP